MTDDSDYSEASDAALKRDGYTCQLCGTVGYPQTERGLAAVPVEPDDYRTESLVTVCHDCLKKDDKQLQLGVQEAYKRRQRRTASTAEDTRPSPDDSESSAQNSATSRFQSAHRYLTASLRSLVVSESPSGENNSDRLIDKVGSKDNFNCQICGSIIRPRGRVGYMMYPFRDLQDKEPQPEDHVSVCLDCVEWEDDHVVEREARKAGRLRNAPKGPSLLYAKSVLREFKEKARLFAHSGRFIVLRRLIAAGIGLAGLLTISILLAGVLGTLFVSPQSGVEWARAAADIYQSVGATLVAAPWIALGALGIGYVAHVYQQERAYERELFRDERRNGETLILGYARPRWQFIAGLAAVGLFGAVDWILVRHDLFPDGMLFGALVFWSVGSAGVAFYLRKALREDRDIHGQPVNPAPWVFSSRYALFVASVSAAVAYLTTASLFPPAVFESVLIVSPLIGALYVGRRLAEQRTVWGARTMYSIRSVIDRVWSLDDDWPPTEQNTKHADPDDTEPKNG